MGARPLYWKIRRHINLEWLCHALSLSLWKRTFSWPAVSHIWNTIEFSPTFTDRELKAALWWDRGVTFHKSALLTNYRGMCLSNGAQHSSRPWLWWVLFKYVCMYGLLSPNSDWSGLTRLWEFRAPRRYLKQICLRYMSSQLRFPACNNDMNTQP